MHGGNEGLTENLGEQGEKRKMGKHFILQAISKDVCHDFGGLSHTAGVDLLHRCALH